MSAVSTRFARPLLATAIAAMALSVPTVGLANKGGVPHNGTHAPKTVTHTPQAKKPCPDKDKGKAKRKGANKGHKKGANKGRKCGQR
jgi:hypothetical protein